LDGAGRRPATAEIGARPVLRAFARQVPRAIFIGASMGGVDAIGPALASLARCTSVPIVVVLHLRPQWAEIVARRAQYAASRPCHLAMQGDVLRPQTIYFAPGGSNLCVLRAAAGLAFRREPPADGQVCPSVDVLFDSAAKALGPWALGIVLTGMGEDGVAGARAIVEEGGSVVVQDEGSSLVWGMPGAVAEAGLASAILPPAALGPMLHRHFPTEAGERP
jgi:two-component system chemotaxis response regulator CheB